MDKKTIKSLIYKAASLLLLSIFLCTSVFIYLQKSFGWFSDNDEVSASGISVQSGTGAAIDIAMSYAKFDGSKTAAEIKALTYTNIGTTASAPIFNQLSPGDKIALKLSFTNNESTVRYLSLSMLAPTAKNETPIITSVTTSGGTTAPRYHYFGSQVRINSVSVNADFDPTYLLKTAEILDENNKPTGFQQTYIENNESVFTGLTDTALVPYTQGASNNVALAGEGATTDVIIVFEFVDNSTIQNAYINFGSQAGQLCQRTLYCTFEDTN